jgi:hypothetical protein
LHPGAAAFANDHAISRRDLMHTPVPQDMLRLRWDPGRIGQHTQVINDDTLNKDIHSNAYSLTAPALHRGSATATFRIDYEPEYCEAIEPLLFCSNHAPSSCGCRYRYCDDCIGVFPADLGLDTRVLSAMGKRCALGIGSDNDGADQHIAEDVLLSLASFQV